MPCTQDTEIRFLSATDRRRLADLLDPADGWRELASRILVPSDSRGSGSRRSNQGSEFLVSPHNMRILEQQRHIPGSSPTHVLIDFWSTTGRRSQRPTVSDLLHILIDCRLTRAARFVATEILEQEFCDGDQCSQHAAGVTASPDHWNPNITFMGKTGDKKVLHVEPSAPVPSIPSCTPCDLRTTVPHAPDCPLIPYEVLAAAANHFREDQKSHKIGEGAFGSVFKACLHAPGGTLVAIKVLDKVAESDQKDQQFLTEVSMMRKFRHPNLLPLIGVSTDGPVPCLVYPFMALGSVNRFLEFSARDLTSSLRLVVAIGTARGLSYLHTEFEQPFVHRDVKSDNILLDADLSPKVGDFGLTRTGSAGTGMTRSRAHTANVIGTGVYMAPEAFRGDVSVKLDVFAFGIVLLELVTGQKSFDEQREESDILSLVEDRLDHWSDPDFDGSGLHDLLDPHVPDWHLPTVQQIMVIAKQATSARKKDRPTITQILESLLQLH